MYRGGRDPVTGHLTLLQHGPQVQVANLNASKSRAGNFNKSFLKKLKIRTFGCNVFFQMLNDDLGAVDLFF